ACVDASNGSAPRSFESQRVKSLICSAGTWGGDRVSAAFKAHDISPCLTFTGAGETCMCEAWETTAAAAAAAAWRMAGLGPHMRWAEHWQAVVGERGVQPWPSASRVMDAAPPSPADVTGAAVAVWRMRLFPPHMPPAKHWRAEAVAQGAGLGQVTPRKAAAAASPAAADATASVAAAAAAATAAAAAATAAESTAVAAAATTLLRQTIVAARGVLPEPAQRHRAAPPPLSRTALLSSTALHCSAATTTTAATLAPAPTAAMASPTVLTFDAEGRAVDFDVWVDDLQLFLQCDSRDGVSLFDHTCGISTNPADTADSTVHSQWTTRDAIAHLAVRSHLPPAERAHFGQYKTAQSLYDAVVARYSSPATTALSRLMLPYLFPDLAAFATVADLVAHLRTSDARYRAALTTDQGPLSLPLPHRANCRPARGAPYCS
ncbi:unnamed protein product, partial [Closterium sp. NIES-54]